MRYFLFSLFFHIIIVTVGGITLKKVESTQLKKEKPNQSLSIDFGSSSNKVNTTNHNIEENIKEDLEVEEASKVSKKSIEKEIKPKILKKEKVEPKEKPKPAKIVEKIIKIEKVQKIERIEELKTESIVEKKLEVVEEIEEVKNAMEVEKIKEVSQNQENIESKKDIKKNNEIKDKKIKSNNNSELLTNKKVSNDGENLPKGLSKLEDGSIVAKNQGVEGLKYKFLSQPNPEYPQIAKKMGIKKEVIVKARFLIGYDGKISDIKFYDDVTNYGFREEVIKALKKWESTQIKIGDKPVKLYFYKAFKFKII